MSIDTKNNGIFLGHLYDCDDEFCSIFFPQFWKTIVNRKSRKLWLIPSRLTQFCGVSMIQFHPPVFNLDVQENTMAGPALVVDEIKISNGIKIFKVFLSGEERYLTETQLRYAKEIT